VTSRSLAEVLSGPRGPGLGRNWVDVLADVPLFQGVPKRHLRKIADVATEARYQPHTSVVKKGERGETFFVILDGTARVETGRQRKRLGMGDCFGEMALLDAEVRSATVSAESELHVMRLSRRRFLSMLEKDPKVAIALLRTLTARLRAAQSASRQ
jgi:CRP-like cAMP-binding protein